MIGLLQRVSEARVEVAGATVAAIERGIMVLVGVQQGDGQRQADRLAERLLSYRVFPDAEGRMNLSVMDIGGGVLLVPQFTLAANTEKGNRASFTTAAEPEQAQHWFECLIAQAKRRLHTVETGSFGADMRVALINEGPVTFWIQVSPDAASR